LEEWLQDNYKEIVFRTSIEADKIKFKGIERIPKTWVENNIFIVQVDAGFEIWRKGNKQEENKQKIARAIEFQIDKNNQVIGFDCKKPNKDILLVEYQKAQDSAEHHDKLVWTTTSIILSGMLILIGFILENLFKTPRIPILFFTGILGISLAIFLIVLQKGFREIKRQKYNRCKEIEQELGMEQHVKLKYEEGKQTSLYQKVLVVFIIFLAFIVLKSLGIVYIAGCPL